MTTIDLKNLDFKNLTPADHERIGEILSEWAESDEFIETLENTPLLPRSDESVARAHEILQAAGRGRPALEESVDGHSPSINTRVGPKLKERLTQYAKAQGLSTSEVVRNALDSYLPQAS